MGDEQTGKEIRAGKAETHWKLIRASVIEASNKGYKAPPEIWAEIEKMVAGIKADGGAEGQMEEAFYDKFVAEGIAPELARSMAQDAAEPRGGRVWG